MIKFVLAIPRYLVSTQLKAIQQLKINRQQYQPLEIKQKLWDLLQQISHEEIHQFIDVYKEFDYDSKEIAEFYNKQLNAEQLILARHLKIEAAKVIDSAYLHILKNDPSLVFKADFDLDSIAKHLDGNGLSTIYASTQRDTLFTAYHKIVENTFYGLYFETLKSETKNIRLIEIIKNLEQQLLKENDPSSVIWKTYLFCLIQGSNRQVINHYSKIITKVKKFTNKEIIIMTQILQTIYQSYGSDASVNSIIRKLNYSILQQKDDLLLEDKICLLIKCTKDFDIQNKQTALCQPIYEKIREIQQYPQVINSLCNHYWNQIKLVEEEEFIDNNLQIFNDPFDLISILYGLIYAESQNIQLIKTILAKIIQLANLNSTQIQCYLYQIVYVLEKLYNIEYEIQDIDQMKTTYFNGTNFKNSPSFSHVNLELLETLQQIKDELSTQKRPDWKITYIKSSVTIGLYTLDFVVELEGVYKKKLIYLDFLQRNAFIDKDLLTGRQRLRKNMLRNENVTFINYYDWYQAENKKEFVKKLLVI